MTLSGAGDVTQEANFCRISVTGISYLFDNEKSEFNYDDLKAKIVALSKAAINDDLYSNDIDNQNDTTIIISSMTALAQTTTEPDLSKTIASQLDLDQDNHFEKPVSNPLQALQITADYLKVNENKSVLLIVIDSPESIAVFFIRTLKEAVKKEKRVYASIALLTQCSQFGQVGSIYKSAGISPQSIEAMILSVDPSLSLGEEVAKLSKFFAESNTNSGKNLSWCSLKINDEQDQNVRNDLAHLVDLIINIQQRVFSPLSAEDIPPQIRLEHSPFYFNIGLRPWFHPQIHPQLRQMNPQPGYIPSLRRAGMHIIESQEKSHLLVLEECEDIRESKQKNLYADWPSEIFTFVGRSRNELAQYLESIKTYLDKTPDQPSMKDLSFSINNYTSQLSKKTLNNGEALEMSMAFVCSDIQELFAKISTAIEICLEAENLTANVGLHNHKNDIFWSETFGGTEDLNKQSKLAFVLPGLGAAYPNMLLDLCLHFPEIRAIFDFIDEIAVLAGDQIKPSDRIFARLDPNNRTPKETPASLAMMDSAVVAVLMAEWAIFTLLLNLEIIPDILLGCSTGEFAALTMSGAIDIMKAAPLFYHLSTGIVRALPMNKIVNLRSLKINASLAAVKSDLEQFDGKVHLSADLSSKQLIVTGDRDSINALVRIFESNNISADFLPFAIPYHTSLVAGVVAANNPDIQALEIGRPLVESWSCSLAQQYPAKPEQIRQMTTDLFSKPILFKESIEALYSDKVKIFVEVGPRGNLAPMISETLQSRPHLSLAANLADRPAVTQLQNILAALYVNNIDMDLAYLYQRRSAQLISFLENSIVQATRAKKLADTFTVPIEPSLNIAEITESFKQQLEKLEEEVMLYLQEGQALIDAGYLSQEVPISHIVDHVEDDQAIVCRELLEELLPCDDPALLLFAQSKLNYSELETFNSFGNFIKRKQWLSGRIATKDSIKAFFRRRFNIIINAKDIEIGTQPSGKPHIVRVSNIHLAQYPVISITHKNGRAIGIAADNSIFASIGIDLESEDIDDHLDEFILSTSERNKIEHYSPEQRSLLTKRMWSAKEAAAKMLGLGLPEFLRKLSVTSIDDNNKNYILVLEQTNGQDMINAPKRIAASVGRLQNMILSVSVTKA